MTKEEKVIVEKYRDKIYFQYETILGVENVLNLRTIKSIAREAGLVKPEVCRPWCIDNELTGDSYTDNAVTINMEQMDFTGNRNDEVLNIYRFCKRFMLTSLK